MKYCSTRGRAEAVSSTRAVLDGIAPDGGLYMPVRSDYSDFDWKSLLSMTTLEMSEKLLGYFLPDFPDMKGIVARAYANKFTAADLTPVVPVGDDYVVELFHGPTAAFKDVALSVLPQLIVAAKQVEGQSDDIMILTATSGDTGKAALEGFRDVPGTRVTVFYPKDGVSTVQQAQMVTQEGNNVCVCAVVGNFDDAQTGVKEIFVRTGAEGLLEGSGAQLSSANSINIGRLVPQLVYYVKAYADLVKCGRIAVGDLVDYVVPTGNFGDILAGYLAKQLGLPVGRLVCASNANNVLTDFFRKGCYDRKRPFYKTESPSMDILVSSNLERLVYLIGGGDPAFVAERMSDLKEKGVYTIPEEKMAAVQAEFWAGCCDDAGTEETIGRVWKEHKYLCDPHTAVAFAVAEQYKAEVKSDRPLVILSTASPYKFPASVIRGLGETPLEDEFAVMDQLQELTGVPVPKVLAGLKEKPVRHKDVVHPDDMLDYVLNLVKKG